MPKILAVCSSTRKGGPKKNVVEAFFEADHGLVGDGDAGPGVHQVAILSENIHDSFQSYGNLQIAIRMGSFGEHLVLEGFDLKKLRLGSTLQINNVILEITKTSSKSHKPYRNFDLDSEIPFPSEGVYAIVKQSGFIREGDEIEVKK